MCIHMSPRRMLLARTAGLLEAIVEDCDNSKANIDRPSTSSNLYLKITELLDEVEAELEAEDASVIA